MPAVSKREFAAGRSYHALWARWREADKTALRVVAETVKPAIPGPDGAMHFDGILSAALLNSGLTGTTMNTLAEHVLPLPLELVWTDEAGRPLWTATDLRPAGRAAVGEAYIHKRYPTDRAQLAVRPAVNLSAGRYKDARIPLATLAAGRFEAWCIGIAEDVRALLAEVTHIGRKGADGFGRVARWTVEPAEVDRAFILERRSVPLAALGDSQVAADRIDPRTSWTPPHWDARFHLPCRAPRWTI